MSTGWVNSDERQQWFSMSLPPMPQSTGRSPLKMGACRSGGDDGRMGTCILIWCSNGGRPVDPQL